MASTGTAQFTVVLNDMIEASLRVLRVLRSGDSASTDQLTAGTQAVNMLIKEWMGRGLMLWCTELMPIPCVADQEAYTIGPGTGGAQADITQNRPLRLYDGSFLRKTIAGVVTDTPLRIIGRQAYEQIKTKAVSGVITDLYYDPCIYILDGSTSAYVGFGTLYVYPPAIDTTYTIYLNVQRQIFDMVSGADEFDVPAEWFNAIKFGLAAATADEYEVPESRITRLYKMAEMALDQLEEWQVRQNDTNFAFVRQQRERAQVQEKPKG